VPSVFQARAGIKPGLEHAILNLSAAEVAQAGHRALMANKRIVLPGSAQALFRSAPAVSARIILAASPHPCANSRQIRTSDKLTVQCRDPASLCHADTSRPSATAALAGWPGRNKTQERIAPTSFYNSRDSPLDEE